MIYKILSGFSNLKQLLLVAAELVGLLILLFALQLLLDFSKQQKSSNEGINNQYYILSKPVSDFQTVLNYKSGFSDQEIAEISASGLVRTVSPFLSSDFPVSASIDENSGLPNFHTDLFFEALPDKYVDLSDMSSWVWDENQEVVPLMLPRAYLNLYNFGYAPGQGLPPLSETLAQSFTFKIRIGEFGRSRRFRARIVGFSDRLNTILVPLSFLEWANARVGSSNIALPTRLIVESEQRSTAEWLQFMEDRSYAFNDQVGVSGKMLALLFLGFGILIILGLIIVLLAFGIELFIQKLSVIEHAKDIEKLHLIGYSEQRLKAPFIRQALVFRAFVALLIFPLFLLLHFQYSLVIQLLFPAGAVSALWGCIAAFFLLGLLLIINLKSITKGVRRQMM